MEAPRRGSALGIPREARGRSPRAPQALPPGRAAAPVSDSRTRARRGPGHRARRALEGPNRAGA
eukprot:CAMPEP_0185201190 /NCGR_PEP_ID=MMETSP1140-20130426/48748_1 /TAXON_ID=298111 /ORGANISM="Pavlova sp., Strain CCMP459" /LENGTH=63 /DNA_ID=CAMNT_0027768571 /DNA_START=170 /DNA_END=358 /DNA_ORIENTATION=-